MPEPKKRNESQQTAITHKEGALLVLAGPGSGKTFVITHRIQYLIQVCHIPPEQILVITFTKAAALEMKERFQTVMKQNYYPVTFGTFHAVFFHILQESSHFNHTSLITEKEKQDYIEAAIEDHMEREERDNGERAAELLAEIGKVKRLGTPLAEYQTKLCEEETFRNIYRSYEKSMQANRKLDFDDMISLCHALLERDDEVRDLWQSRYRYILIDEFQDINLLQYTVIKQLAMPENNVFAVGDDDQSIYGFRGSRPELMQQFEQEFHAERMELSTNYRCTDAILQAALRVIGQNKNRFPKKSASYKEAGEPVVQYGFQSKEEEAENILRLIAQYAERRSIADIAVIYRTNAEAEFLAEKLSERKIAFRIKERLTSLYGHFTAKDIRSYAELALSGQREACYRIMNKPKRYLSRAAFQGTEVSWNEVISYYGDKRYMKEIIQKLQYDCEIIRTMRPYAGITYIRKVMGYDTYLQSMGEEMGGKTKEWIAVLEEIQDRAKTFTNWEAWFQHTKAYEKELRRQKTATSIREEAVSLLTMHGAKGLEYPIVILPELNAGTIPHKKAALPMQVEEERRMLYVAMTRAKERLFLFWVLQPSIFLKEL